MLSHPVSRPKSRRTALVTAGILLGRSLASLAGSPPVIDDLVPLDSQNLPSHVAPRVPVGKALIFPITAADPDGGPLKYTVVSHNSKIFASVRTGLPKLKMEVSHDGDSTGTDPQFSGTLEFLLLRDLAPLTVGNISGLTQGHYYHGQYFNRIADLDPTAEPNGSFILQGGDPLAKTYPPFAGLGGPGFTFANEFHPAAMFAGRGQLAMANSGSNVLTYAGSNGSQFFITDGSPRHLDFNHNIFGQLLRGWDTLSSMTEVPRYSAPANPSAYVDPPADYPKVPVRLDTATVEPDFSDAVLLVSAIGPESGTITITVTDQEGMTASKDLTVTAYADPTNSPPFLRPVPNQSVVKGKVASVPIEHVDLEGDYCVTTGQALFTSNGQAAVSGNRAYFLGSTNFSSFNVGLSVTQYDMTYRGSIDGSQRPADDKVPIVVSVGDKQVRTTARKITGLPGVELTNVAVAQYIDGDPVAQPGDFTATVIWGDGTYDEAPAPKLSNGTPVDYAGDARFSATITRDPNSPLPGAFFVTATHTYSNPGVYPVTVDLVATKGQRVTVRSTSVISAGPVRVFGRTFENNGRQVADAVLATFLDDAPAGLSAYSARIHWGDGELSDGLIRRAASGDLQIVGTHTYEDASDFAVTVELTKTGDPNSPAFGWSRVSVSAPAAPLHLPPYPVPNLVGQLGSSSNISNDVQRVKSGSQTAVAAQLVVVNSGSKSVTNGKLRFYLSEDKKTNLQDETNNPKDLLVKVGALPEIRIPTLAPNAGIRYVFDKLGQGDFRLKFPSGEGGEGLNLIAHFEYSDPIGDSMPIGHDVVVGPFNSIFVEPTVLTVQESAGDGASAKFTVKLAKQPRAGVTIPITLNTAATAQITVSTNTITLTPQNWNTGQEVTVTAKDDTTTGDTMNVTVALGTATSTDLRFNGQNPADVVVGVKDKAPTN